MKAVILAGGLGSRLAEETYLRPKPMIEIGGQPILWHIMKIYSQHGINDFVVCLGYKGFMIKDFFANYALHGSDVTFDLANNAVELHRRPNEPWRVTLVETGLNSQTGGRLGRIRPFVGNDDFCMTYGDGVADIDIGKLVAFHSGHQKAVTVTAVQPVGRYGSLDLDHDKVNRFIEKPLGDGGWISGGFFVLSPRALDYVDNDTTSWEYDSLTRLAKDEQVMAYRHHGFWQAMDTQRDKDHLDLLWRTGRAAWKIWE
ncbi:MAG: glucose-1-phosphate cytidylyltransferase [Rhodobacteraceae bacterium]|nr:glucose-1-phosphate cytidylyltransferase [Paracoccaceae bacterium]